LTVVFGGKPPPVTPTVVFSPPVAGARFTEGFARVATGVAVGSGVGVKVPVGVGAPVKSKTALTLTLKSWVATRIINLFDGIGAPFVQAVGMVNAIL